MWQKVGSYADDQVDAPDPNPEWNSINLNRDNGLGLREKNIILNKESLKL